MKLVTTCILGALMIMVALWPMAGAASDSEPSLPHRVWNTTKHVAHRTWHSLEHVGERTGETVKHEAHRTGQSIKHVAHGTEHAPRD